MQELVTTSSSLWCVLSTSIKFHHGSKLCKSGQTLPSLSWWCNTSSAGNRAVCFMRLCGFQWEIAMLIYSLAELCALWIWKSTQLYVAAKEEDQTRRRISRTRWSIIPCNRKSCNSLRKSCNLNYNNIFHVQEVTTMYLTSRKVSDCVVTKTTIPSVCI